jgi:uncharacterized protein YkwD
VQLCPRFVVLVLVLSFATATPAPAQKPPAKKDELKLTADEQAVIDLTNAERKAAGLPPLTASPKLMAAARSHAANMAKQEKPEHVLDGKEPVDRVKEAGYRFRATGENVAWNQANPKEVLADWMKSPGHRENILRKEYTEIGVAVAKSQKGEPYWVQVFGTPLGK